jgi:hypothetical protein
VASSRTSNGRNCVTRGRLIAREAVSDLRLVPGTDGQRLVCTTTQHGYLLETELGPHAAPATPAATRLWVAMPRPADPFWDSRGTTTVTALTRSASTVSA